MMELNCGFFFSKVQYWADLSENELISFLEASVNLGAKDNLKI
jgi:hypothetical protein